MISTLLPPEASYLVKTDFQLIEEEVAGQRGQAFLMVHHLRERTQERSASTAPVVLSVQAMEELVQELQRALLVAALAQPLAGEPR